MDYGWNILLDPESDAGGGAPSSVSEPVDSAASADASPQTVADSINLSRADYDQLNGRATSADGNNAFFERARGAGIDDLNSVSDQDLAMISAFRKNNFSEHDLLRETMFGAPQTQPEGPSNGQQTYTRDELNQELDKRFAQHTERGNLTAQYESSLGVEEKGFAALRDELGLAGDIPKDDMVGQLMHLAMEGYRMSNATGLIDDENHPMHGQLNPFGEDDITKMGEFFRGMKENLSAHLQFQMAKKTGGTTPTANAGKVAVGNPTDKDPSQMSDAQLQQAQEDIVAGVINERRKARGGQPVSVS